MKVDHLAIKAEVVNPSPGVTRDGMLPLVFSRDRLWFWGTRSVLSLMDQGILSGSSLLLNVALARWLGKDAYGVFAVCFAGFLFVSGIHNVLVIEPMTVLGSSRYLDRLMEYFSGQIRIHMFIALGITSVVLVTAIAMEHSRGGNPLLSAIIALGISLPFILLLWVTRRMCYVLQNPLAAVQASGLYGLILIGAMTVLWRINWLTPATAFLIMAVASLLSSLFVLVRFPMPERVVVGRGIFPLLGLLRENWDYASWLVLTSILSWMSVQVQTVLTAGFLNLRSSGALRAMQLPSLLMSQLITAAMLLLLPSMSQELGRGLSSRLHQKAVLVSAVLAVFGLAFAATLFLIATPLEHLLFGGKYASEAWLIPVLSLAPIFTGLSSGLSFALRTLRKSKFELLAYMVSAAFAIGSALFLVPRLGLPGAAVSIVGSTAVLAVSVVACYLKWGRVDDYRSADTLHRESTA